jgi:hypothetical protein
MSGYLAISIAALAITVLIFLVFRAIVLWYWRVNVAVELLKEINEKLERIAAATPAGR